MYTDFMLTSPAALAVLLDDAVTRDRTTARRSTLTQILLEERFLTREQLIVRVEGRLGRDCFGASAWEDLFYRDMQVVKRALRAAGYQLAYSRSRQQPGYYLRGQPAIGADLAAALDGSVAEVDQAQISIFKTLSLRQRFLQGCSISSLASRVVAHRNRQRHPSLSLAEAFRLAVRQQSP